MRSCFGNREQATLTWPACPTDLRKRWLCYRRSLAAYAKNPDSKAEKELYASISSVPFIIYNDYLVDLLSTQEIPDALWNLCHRWLYHAFAPEVLKLAITVTGLHLLNEENLNEVERLHKDLMLLARCEELTSFVSMPWNWGISLKMRTCGKS